MSFILSVVGFVSIIRHHAASTVGSYHLRTLHHVTKSKKLIENVPIVVVGVVVPVLTMFLFVNVATYIADTCSLLYCYMNEINYFLRKKKLC